VAFLLAVVDDLFFSVQVTEMAKRAGLPVRYTRNLTDTLTQAAENPALVLVDLNLKETDTVALIRALKTAHPELPVAAYVSQPRSPRCCGRLPFRCHPIEALLTLAPAPALARSAFAAKVPVLLLLLAFHYNPIDALSDHTAVRRGPAGRGQGL
jgi:CheY-like chemotaxis protein